MRAAGFHISTLLLLLQLSLFSQNDTATINKLNDRANRLRRANPDSGVILANTALSRSESIDYLKGIIEAHNNLGMSEFHKNNFKTALEQVKKALALTEKSGLKDAQAETHYNLCLIYRVMADYGKAIDHGFKALRIYEETGNKTGIGHCYNDIANVYYGEQNYPKALEFFKKAIPIMENSNPKQKATLFQNLGLVYTDLKNFDTAMYYFNQSLAIRQKFGSPLSLADVYTNIGVCLSAKGDQEQAIGYFFKAKEVYEKNNSEYQLEIVLTNIGDAYVRLKRYREGAEYLHKGLDLARRIDDKEGMKVAYGAISDLYAFLGDFKKAFMYNRRYLYFKDSLLSLASQNGINELQTQYETEKRDREIELLSKDKELKENIIQRQNAQRVAFIAGIALLAGVLFFIVRGYRLKQKANLIITAQKEEVEHQKKTIEEKNKDITDSITYARRIQKAILPAEEAIKENLPDSFILYKPKDIVAGDFYFFETNGPQLFIAAADCTGHGVPGAMVSVVCSNALHRAVQEFGETEPGRILDRARQMVIETFERSGADVKDGMDVSLCTIEKQENGAAVKWAGANNPLWYISNGVFSELTADKQPIGKFAVQKPFTTQSLRLGKGDSLYIFTDGYPDQFGGEKGKKFKYRQLQELLTSMADLPMNEQKMRLEKAFNEWKGSHEQVDDVCVIGIRI